MPATSPVTTVAARTARTATTAPTATGAEPLTAMDRAGVYAVSGVLAGIGVHLLSSSRAARTFGAGAHASEAVLFRRATGLRTAWLGVVALTLLRAGQHRALGWTLVAMAANPASDLVLAASSGGRRRALAHVPGTVATAALGARLLRLTGSVCRRR